MKNNVSKTIKLLYVNSFDDGCTVSHLNNRCFHYRKNVMKLRARYGDGMEKVGRFLLFDWGDFGMRKRYSRWDFS